MLYGPRIHAAGDGRLREGIDQTPIGCLPFWRLVSLIDGTLTVTNGANRSALVQVRFVQHTQDAGMNYRYLQMCIGLG